LQLSSNMAKQCGMASNSPPLFFSVGQEMLRDEDAVLAQRAAAQGVTIVWREFEAMPHCFAMLLESCNGSPLHHQESGAFCRDVVEGKVGASNGVFIVAKTLERREVDVKSGLTEITESEVEGYMRKGQERIASKFARGADPAEEAGPML
jgi:acetyl esterase/lipase